MRISIDIDGVLNQFVAEVISISNKLWPGKVPQNYEPPDWYWTDIFTKKDWDQVWDVINATENFWAGTKPYDDNLAALQEFLSTCPFSTEVLFVTSRAKTAGQPVAKQTFDWFAKHFVGIANNVNYSPIVVVPSSKNKKQVIEALEIQYSIDDLGPTVEMCQSIPNHTAYVLDRPWNRDKEYGPRVNNLKEFLDIVKESK